MQPVKAYHERQRRQVHMTIKSGYEIQNNIAASKVHTRGKNYNELKFFSGHIKNPADKKNYKKSRFEKLLLSQSATCTYS